jgi:hypothetical protein
MYKNLLIVFIIAFIGLSCGSVANSKLDTTSEEQGVDFDTATFQYWVAGVKGGGSGYTFNLSLKKELPKNVVLQKVIFRKKSALFIKIDEIHYNANLILRAGGRDGDTQTPNVESNINDTQAQIFYTIDGKEVSRIIDNVKELPMLASPSAKPRNN